MAEKAILIDYGWCTGCHTCEVACQMEHGLPTDQFGIKIMEIGPWEYAPDKWQYTYLPVPTDQCDLCSERVEQGKLPTCVHHCQAMCMEFGDISELAEKLGEKPRRTLFHPRSTQVSAH